MNGTILTFYSYKGGTGRSMAVANIAWILANNGLRVLVVDWDLEAPGLHRYFHPFLPDPELRSSPGIIDLLWAFAEAAVDPDDPADDLPDDPAWYEQYAQVAPYAVSVQYDAFPGAGTVDLVPAGRQNPSYANLVSAFDWDDFYDRLGGGGFLEALKRDMRSGYDYVLIDSRTGLSDTASICTVQMPDVLVDCFSLSTQAIDGAAAVATSAQSQHRSGHLKVFPVPMRVEDAELDKLDASRDYARARFGRFLSHVDDPDRYWGEVEIPYKSFYAYEETLATVGDRPRQENTVLAATERVVAHLTDGRVTELRSQLTETERRALLSRFQRHLPVAGQRAAGTRLQGVPPRVFIAYTYDSAEHFSAVRELWYLLREQGADARLDQPPGQRRADWVSWLADEVRAADVVLEVVPAARVQDARAEDAGGAAPPRAADLVRDELGLAPKPHLAVVLPGGSTEQAPAYLTRSTGRPVVVEHLTAAGVEPLSERVARAARSRSAEPPAAAPLGSGWEAVASAMADPELVGTAVTLRRLVTAQLEGEAAFRRLTAAAPLPVRWHMTERPTLGPADGMWLQGGPVRPEEPLTGVVQRLYEGFLTVPTRQMVLLGDPGAGKTTALILLALRMLKGQIPEGAAPVPVLLSAATWRPDTESLRYWIARRLREDYSGPLHTPLGSHLVRELADSPLILPILDGLDELPSHLLDLALNALAEAPFTQPLLVACRTEPYHAAFDRTGQTLRKAAVIELQPLAPDDAADYLQASASSSGTRWNLILEALRQAPEAPVSRVLTTPLLLDLVRTSYQAPRTDPTELLSFPEEGIRTQLHRRYLPAVYSARPQHPGRGSRYPAERVTRWFSFLAEWQIRTGQGTDIAWWRLHTSLPRAASRAWLGLFGAAFGGLFMFIALTIAITANLDVLYAASDEILQDSLITGGLLGAATALVASPPQSHRGILERLTTSRPLQVLGRRWPSQRSVSPQGALRNNRSGILLIGFVACLLSTGPTLAAVLAGNFTGALILLAATLAALLVLLNTSAWGWYTVTRWRLALHGSLPWRPMSFLEDAHSRGVLRQQGAVYSFRHDGLRNSLLVR
ncbi:KGGVGR-motif variant AAA ATPase [Streptomyces sp. H39-S7]|uniref:KGGVGR-motif variant AAA ATPase n=1 Tax=Streptomyces sp. H39-S7 TaxID=3004357 RepID=UPI0022AE8895|nr:NACHT domain-containing protein [Streptomyces sp. H39-S7]MCZ4125926.1 NACHT domain-containing protein [Streptomyces sp. H39-S7]